MQYRSLNALWVEPINTKQNLKRNTNEVARNGNRIAISFLDEWLREVI